ncbi:hypothetical protein EMCRGX_G014341 [Ephydatia muelleri]
MDNSYQESNPTDYTYGDTGLEDISDSALDETIHDTHEEQIDSDSDFEFGAYFEELENTTNESYYPFPSKIFALLFLLVYSPHPMGRRNLTFVWFILKSMGVKTPSMSSVMAFKLPETEASLKHCTRDQVPFYCIPVSSIIRQSLGRPDIASAIVRHPVCTEDKYIEMFHGNRWHTDNRFMSPMVKLTDGTSCFVYDCVKVVYPLLGTTTGIIQKYFHKSCLKEVLAEVDILLDLAQFRQMVPDTTATHMDTDALILYHSSAVIAVRDILGFAEPPRIVVRWTPPNFSRMTLQETTSYLSPHPMKAKAAGKPVVMLPIILFSDDTSGNKSKKWHKFESWYMSLAGLPRHINARIENIHFLCCSDSVCPLDMSKPISEELVRLEQEGVVVYDALYKEMVLVIAPLMCIVCDNPRASELLNHLGSSAIKYCRICMCDKTENPDELSELRTMSLALQQIAEIEALRTEQEKIEMRKLYGVRETLNPLFSIHADLYRCLPIEVLHTLLLGICKYILKHVMSGLSARQKAEILARVKSFDISGFRTKMYGNVCQHYKSFVGRDFKGWSQMALFILGPYLDGGQTQVLLTFSKVFQIAYCEFFCVQLSEEWKGICCSFIDSVKTHMPLLLNKPKTHLILHLVDCMIDFGPSSAFSAESNAAYYVWHSNGRSARDSSYLSARNTQKGQKIYLKDLPLTLAGKQKNTLEELQSNSHNYNVQLGEHALTDKVLEYRALICSERSLVNSGENIEFVTSYDQFMYGILLATFTTHNAAWCLVQGILPLVSLDNQPILNPYDCPLLELSNTIFCTPSCNIKRPAPLVHECTDTCIFQETMQARTVERENILCSKLVFQHDWSNPTYCCNVYCTR